MAAIFILVRVGIATIFILGCPMCPADPLSRNTWEVWQHATDETDLLLKTASLCPTDTSLRPHGF